MDLIFQLTYMVALLHYAILPPITSTDSTLTAVPGLRECYLMVYSFAQICNLQTFAATPYLLTILSFATCLPSIPYPQDYAYSTLLAALSANMLMLHLPVPPSPLFLLPFENVLPLSVLIWHGTSKIFLPTLLFFLPALLLAFFLLSTSLSDTLLQTNANTMEPSPLEARMAFLFLLAVLFILLLCSLVMLILVYPTLSSATPPPSSWDRYSRSIGLDARRKFVEIVVHYSTPYVFPPPFNLLSLITRVPFYMVGLLRRHSWRAKLVGFEGWLWRITVGPMALVVAGVWGWGVRWRSS